MLPDLHIGFSRGRSGGLVFPSLSEFSTVYCDSHKDFGIVNKAEIDVFLDLSCFFNDPADVGNLNKSQVPFNTEGKIKLTCSHSDENSTTIVLKPHLF